MTPAGQAAGKERRAMLVKMRRDATRDEVAAVEDKLHTLGFKTGKMVGEEITLVGVYGDISTLPVGEIEELPGVEQLIPISRAYKRAAQKGPPDRPIYQTVAIGNVVCGGDELCFISGPCSVESEAQIMEAARLVKEAGGNALRGGVVKYRSSPLPVIHKRGNSLDTEAYLLWVERMMTGGKENVILCERGIASANRYTRNTLDCGSIAAYRYQLSGLPIAVDASHGTGIRDLVHPATLAGIMAGASVVLVEAHPNPLIAKSDGFQGLFPEQLRALVRAAREAWRLRRELDRSYLASAAVEKEYLARMEADKARLFRSGHGHGPHEGPS